MTTSMSLACEYAYDAVGVLTRVGVPGNSSARFWRGGEVVNALHTIGTGESRLTWLRAGGQPVLEQVSGTGARVTLLAAAVSGSVLLEADSAVRTAAYAPHGARAEDDDPADAKAELAFNGELLDSNSGCYLLGAGHHRPYSPTLGMFLAPDPLAPFDEGGLNVYAYCGGDPINRSDPSGHFWKWIVAGIAVVAAVATLGVMAAAGAAALTASAVVGAALITASAGLEVAAALVKDEKLSMALGIAGLATGLAGGAAAGAAIAKGAANIKGKAVKFIQRVGTIRKEGLSGRGGVRAGREMARRTTVFARPGGSTPSLGGAPARSNASRLVGYHGTSSANADKMLQNGATGMYLTDRYESALHYARIAGGDDGVVLGFYADDLADLGTYSAPKTNVKSIAEVIHGKGSLRAVRVDAGAPPIDDFFEFWKSRVASHEDLLAQLQRRMGAKEWERVNARYT